MPFASVISYVLASEAKVRKSSAIRHGRVLLFKKDVYLNSNIHGGLLSSEL